MELTKQQTTELKGIAILMMLFLHLFNKSYMDLFQPLVFVRSQPVSHYLSLFCDCCIAIYCFCSGYGLYIGYSEDKSSFNHKNRIRIFKLYINYWVIIVVFVFILGGLVLQKWDYIGGFWRIVLNATALNNSYNGAWWFLITYLLLSFLSPYIFRLVEYTNKYLLTGGLLIFYTFAYFQRFHGYIYFDNVILNWFINQIAMFGICLLPFCVGALFYNERIFSRLSIYLSNKSYVNPIFILGIILLIVIHGFIPSFYIAVFTCAGFIILWSQIKNPRWLDVLFLFFGKHSTNFWLIHMFFMTYYFKNFIYSPRYVPLIFGLLVVCCLLGSYIVNLIYKPMLKLLKI